MMNQYNQNLISQIDEEANSVSPDNPTGQGQNGTGVTGPNGTDGTSQSAVTSTDDEKVQGHHHHGGGHRMSSTQNTQDPSPFSVFSSLQTEQKDSSG